MSRWYWASLSMVYVIFSTAISPQNGTMLCTLQQFFTLLPLIWLYFGFMYLSCSVATRIFPSLSLSLSRLHIFLLPPLYPSLSPSFSSFSFWLCVLCLISLVYFVDFYSNRICNKYIENYVLLYEHTTIPLDKPHTLNANGWVIRWLLDL